MALQEFDLRPLSGDEGRRSPFPPRTERLAQGVGEREGEREVIVCSRQTIALFAAALFDDCYLILLFASP